MSVVAIINRYKYGAESDTISTVSSGENVETTTII